MEPTVRTSSNPRSIEYHLPPLVVNTLCHCVTPFSNSTKNALVNLQVLVEFENGATQWHNVFTTKGGKWYSIDRGLLEVLTVGSMRTSFPEMCDMNLWELVGAKTWADKTFTKN